MSKTILLHSSTYVSDVLTDAVRTTQISQSRSCLPSLHKHSSVSVSADRQIWEIGGYDRPEQVPEV